MARYTGPKVKLSRRLSTNLFENEKGRKALDRGDIGALRGIVRDLNRLMPADVRERQRGYESGVR